MYPAVTIRKFLPDGSQKLVIACYRLPDRRGFARFFLPDHTTRVHTRGTWTPEGISIAAFDPSRPYAIHWWRGPEGSGFYVDAARSIALENDGVSYVDLFIDLTNHGGTWRTLDEEELGLLSPADAVIARRATDEILAMAQHRHPILDPGGDLWQVPDDALTLPALPIPRLGQGDVGEASAERGRDRLD